MHSGIFLVKAADNIKVFSAGFGYKQLELKQYIQLFKDFDVYETDVRYFLPFNTAITGKYIKISERKSIAKNALKNYFSIGVVSHFFIKKYHIGFGALLGKRVFSIMDNGMDMQHHPFEFKYSFFLKFGRSFGKHIFHVGTGFSKAKELPFNNPDVKIFPVSVDYSYKF